MEPEVEQLPSETDFAPVQNHIDNIQYRTDSHQDHGADTGTADPQQSRLIMRLLHPQRHPEKAHSPHKHIADRQEHEQIRIDDPERPRGILVEHPLRQLNGKQDNGSADIYPARFLFLAFVKGQHVIISHIADVRHHSAFSVQLYLSLIIILILIFYHVPFSDLSNCFLMRFSSVLH